MSDKITITNDEINEPAKGRRDANPDRIVICEIPTEAEHLKRKDIPLSWYLVLLLPFVNLVALAVFFMQKKYTLRHPATVVTAVAMVISIFCAACIIILSASRGGEWKYKIAQKAKTGVVIVNTEYGLGAGFVIAKRGDTSLILTNYHVITTKKGKLADRIQVETSLGATFDARVAALPQDTDIDMALLLVRSGNNMSVLGDIGAFSALREGGRCNCHRAPRRPKIHNVRRDYLRLQR